MTYLARARKFRSLKPEGPVEIDWSHELARNLAVCLPITQAGKDQINLVFPIETWIKGGNAAENIVLGVNSRGRFLRASATGSDSASLDGDARPSYSAGEDHSYFIKWSALETREGNGRFLSRTSGDSLSRTASDKAQLRLGGTVRATSTASMVSEGSLAYLSEGTLANNKHHMYVDGKFDNTWEDTTGVGELQKVSRLLGWDGAGNGGLDMEVYYDWRDRLLTADDVAWFHAEPYVLLKSRVQRLFFQVPDVGINVITRTGRYRTIKPEGSVEIDWSHQLARGFESGLLPTSAIVKTLQDLGRGPALDISTLANASAGTEPLEGRVIRRSGNYNYSTSNPIIEDKSNLDNSIFTVVGRGAFIASTGGGVFIWRDTDGPSGFMLTFAEDTGSTFIMRYRQVFAGGSSNSTAITRPTDGIGTYGWALDGSNMRCFLDGKFEQSVSITKEVPVTTPRVLLYHANFISGETPWNWWSWQYLWSRQLTDDEVKWITEEPYVFLKPRIQRLYFGAAAPAAGDIDTEDKRRSVWGHGLPWMTGTLPVPNSDID